MGRVLFLKAGVHIYLPRRGESEMQEKTVSTMNELLNLIKEYGNNGFYFRGENRDYKETSCLPSYLRRGNCKKLDFECLKRILEYLGVGFPFIPPKDDSSQARILGTIINFDSWRFLSWGEEQLKALAQHYIPDFKALKSLEEIQALGHSSYLDITTDIYAALHFSCSEYCFLFKDKIKEPVHAETADDGFLFVFDLKEIEKTAFLKLVSYPGYAYFCKNGDDIYYQSFDRITHQRGAFLAPKRNEKGTIEYLKLHEEIKTQIHTKVIIQRSLKKELYKIFGNEEGLDYYFPKIPCTFLQTENKICQDYRNLKGATVFI
jgi:hypothetical protein